MEMLSDERFALMKLKAARVAKGIKGVMNREARRHEMYSRWHRMPDYSEDPKQLFVEAVAELELLYAWLDEQDEADEYNWREAYAGFKLRPEVKNGEEAEEED